jgi:hypothetical protein
MVDVCVTYLSTVMVREWLTIQGFTGWFLKLPNWQWFILNIQLLKQQTS